MSLWGRGWRSKSRGVQKFVLLAIARHADHSEAATRPTLAQLADMTGLSESTVRRAIGALRASGELERLFR